MKLVMRPLFSELTMDPFLGVTLLTMNCDYHKH
jgi:hypothetical protein